MSIMRFVFTFLVCVLVAAPAEARNLRALIGTHFTETPLRVVDGDTIRMKDGAVRLWGFNTPEKYQPRFFAAAAKLEELVVGQKLDCHIRDIDRYQRRVAQCFLPDGRDVGELMVSSGLARDYTRYSKGYYKRYEKLAFAQ
jgi:micrococcal nuclease